MKGVFVGAKLGRSNVTGTYVGDEDSIATSVGGFMVKRLEPKLYADGYISMEFSRNNQDLTSSGSSYTGDYTARTTTMGGNLTGITSYGRYELRHTGGIEYISTRQSAYTLSSTTDIALAESTTQLASVWYAPEFRVAKGKGAMMYKPSVTCEHARDSTVDTDCGGGVSVYYLEEKQDDTKLRVGGSIEQIGGQLRSDLTLKLEKKF